MKYVYVRTSVSEFNIKDEKENNWRCQELANIKSAKKRILVNRTKSTLITPSPISWKDSELQEESSNSKKSERFKAQLSVETQEFSSMESKDSEPVYGKMLQRESEQSQEFMEEPSALKPSNIESWELSLTKSSNASNKELLRPKKERRRLWERSKYE